MPYLAGFVPEQYKIQLIDEYSETIVYKRYDLVAITVNTPNAPHVYQMAKEFRKLGSWVVFGGPHATLYPEEAALNSDTVFIGEAEESWPKFLREFLTGDQQRGG